jgi:TolB-like protein
VKTNCTRVLCAALLFAACGTADDARAPGGAAEGLSLEEGIAGVAAAIEQALPQGTRVAVVNFKTPSARFSDFVLEELQGMLIHNRQLVVVDRKYLELRRRELTFQMSGEVSDESAQSIGHMLGAQSIVSGVITKIGPLYRVQVKAIEVQTAGVQAQWSRNIPYGATIAALTENKVPAATGTAAAASTAATTTVAAVEPAAVPAPNQPRPSTSLPAVPVYKVGDIGPAGGVIFYDKGNNSGGWRYLEVSPVETERTAAIFYNNRSTVVGSRRLGEGKENTKKFITQFQRDGGGINSAAWLCNELTVNGFDDWYLPSLDEVLYMYNNLYLQGLADLKTDRYWTSYIGYKDDIWERVFYVDFADGSERNFDLIWRVPEAKCQVRAIRQF